MHLRYFSIKPPALSLYRLKQKDFQLELGNHEYLGLNVLIKVPALILSQTHLLFHNFTLCDVQRPSNRSKESSGKKTILKMFT